MQPFMVRPSRSPDILLRCEPDASKERGPRDGNEQFARSSRRRRRKSTRTNGGSPRRIRRCGSALRQLAVLRGLSASVVKVVDVSGIPRSSTASSSRSLRTPRRPSPNSFPNFLTTRPWRRSRRPCGTSRSRTPGRGDSGLSSSARERQNACRSARRRTRRSASLGPRPGTVRPHASMAARPYQPRGWARRGGAE